MKHSELICLLGPTASGKTQVALEIATRLPCEIINVDSALVYRGMDIGTAKPKAQARAQVLHHLIDIRDPTVSYSAAEFRDDALSAIQQIRARHRIPLLVGGTMFYFYVLEHGLSPIPKSKVGVRDKIVRRGYQEGSEALHQELTQLDPVAAARIHPKDRQRITRALDVCLSNGMPLSQFQQSARPRLNERLHYIAIEYAERKCLHRQIEQRFAQMLECGLLGEVATLMLRGDLNLDLPSMRAIGYRQVWQHLIGDYDFNQMKMLVLAASRQFAKRQLTWMRRMPITTRYASEHLSPAQTAQQIITTYFS